MRVGRSILALVGLFGLATADIIQITQHTSCNGTVVKNTYVVNGACQVKGKTSVRQTITNSVLLTEKFTNGACQGTTPFATKKDTTRCDEKTFETIVLNQQFPALDATAAVTVYGCDKMYAVSTDNSKCNPAAVGKCIDDKASFCGSDRDKIVDALTTGRSVFVLPILEGVACYAPDRYRTYYTVNGACTPLGVERGYRYGSSRRTVIGDDMTVQFYATHNCTGAPSFTQTGKKNGCQYDSQIYTAVPALPQLKDDAEVILWVAPKCGAIESISVETQGFGCPDTGRGVCEDLRGSSIYRFCGNEVDFFLDAFMKGEAVGSE